MYRAQKNEMRCIRCMICEQHVACAAGQLFSEGCNGCGACAAACPAGAVEFVRTGERPYIPITVDEKTFEVPDGISIKDALSLCGFKVGRTPDCDIFTPCEVGACYACAVVVNGHVAPSCTTAVGRDMQIITALPDDYVPRRAVSGFSPHMVGGVGTPYALKNSIYFIEAASFHHGCLFRCPQCQNHVVAYTGNTPLLTPVDTAMRLAEVSRAFGLDRIAYSGGESTLNRDFLVQCLKETRKLCPCARLHVDTNGALLTPDYIDELVDAGMTDIGIDLKAAAVDTFMRIAGVDEALAEYCGNNAWDAVRYLTDNYKEKVFLGIGIPYNRQLISLDEVQVMGDAIAAIDADVQVCVLDYRPAFRRQDLLRPGRTEMLAVKKVLNSAGLRTVIVQVPGGHIGP